MKSKWTTELQGEMDKATIIRRLLQSYFSLPGTGGWLSISPATEQWHVKRNPYQGFWERIVFS